MGKYWNKSNRISEMCRRDQSAQDGAKVYGTDGRRHEVGDKVGKNGAVVKAGEKPKKGGR